MLHELHMSRSIVTAVHFCANNEINDYDDDDDNDVH